MIKIILINIFAILFLVSSLNAKQSLIQWANNTTVSGLVKYNLSKNIAATSNSDTTEEIEVNIKLSMNITDNIKTNLKYSSTAKTENNETKANTELTEANFISNNEYATFILGLQTTQTPFFANNGDTRSHGITALIPSGSKTIAATYYTTTTTTPILVNNVMALGVIGDAKMISYELWYATFEDAKDVDNKHLPAVNLNNAKAYNINISSTRNNNKTNLTISKLQNNNKTGSLLKITSVRTLGEKSFTIGYIRTGNESPLGNSGGQIALDNNTNAKSDLALEQLAMSATTDASAFLIATKLPSMDKVTFNLEYLRGTSKFHSDFSELDITAKHNTTKNLYTYLKYFTGTDIANSKFSGLKVEVKYSF